MVVLIFLRAMASGREGTWPHVNGQTDRTWKMGPRDLRGEVPKDYGARRFAFESGRVHASEWVGPDVPVGGGGVRRRGGRGRGWHGPAGIPWRRVDPGAV